MRLSRIRKKNNKGNNYYNKPSECIFADAEVLTRGLEKKPGRFKCLGSQLKSSNRVLNRRQKESQCNNETTY